MSNSPGILIVDGDAVVAHALQQALTVEGYATHHADSVEAGLERLECIKAKTTQETIGVVLIDQDAAGISLDKMRRLQNDRPLLVPIVTSAFRKVESAVSAMRMGAADYLLKPIVEAELIDAVGRAMQRHLLMIERELSQQDVAKPRVESGNSGTDDGHAEDWQPMPLSEAMKAPERRILLAALKANGWNRGRTAEQLDINRTTLYKKIRQHRLDEPA